MKIAKHFVAITASLLFLPLLALDMKGKAAEETDQIIKLKPIASGFSSITDIQFLPQSTSQAVILEKGGSAFLLDRSQKERKSKLLELKVATESELGLLGLAFHPRFSQTKKVFIHYNPTPKLSRISEWQWSEDSNTHEPATLKNERVILEIEQPYKNHDGGSLVFGPDGFLYIGLGDGGSRGDPGDRAQNLSTLLGKMLRINIDGRDKNLAYSIPSDNPFTKSKSIKEGPRPEIFAWGLRNPWKYSFDNKGRLIAGDVGQDTWEEITFVPRGRNLGWRIFEGTHCYKPAKNCESILKDSVIPLTEYGRNLGASVTGGFQYSGRLMPALRGRYIFGDFVSGRLFSIPLPENIPTTPGTMQKPQQHGKFEISISTFAKDAAGEMYVADFIGGSIYQLTQEKLKNER